LNRDLRRAHSLKERSTEKVAVRAQLERWLSGAKKVVVLCIGSRARTDDAFGPILARELKWRVPKHIAVVDAETVPENYTGTIRRLNPTHILMVDAADMGLPAGESRLLKAEEIEGFVLSTHAPPLRVIARYLSMATAAKIALLAVQPKCLDFGEGLTEELKMATKAIAETLTDVLS